MSRTAATAFVAATPPILVAGAVGIVLLGAISQPGIAPAGWKATEHARTDIPKRLFTIYTEAAQRCPNLSWAVLAAVGKVESDHARSGGAQLAGDGEARPWIIGSALDGSAGVRAIADTDEGKWDRDTVWDRAVGPMQFLPSTWRTYGVDASGNGDADPHNAVDAVHTAADYLCAHGAGELDGVRHALFAYNNADWYVDDVFDIAARYGGDPVRPIVADGGSLLRAAYGLPVDRDRLTPEQLNAPHHSYPAWDLPLPLGTPIAAVHSGHVVSISALSSRCGLGVVIHGDDGARYSYCHASEVQVVVSEHVEVGQQIMNSGNSGRSTGPHLHLDIRWHGELICPQPLLQSWYDRHAATPADAPTSGCSY